jgi:hypothetical protein
MGNAALFGSSNLYDIYRRELTSDKYEVNAFISCMRESDNEDLDALGYFKHEVYEFAMHRYANKIKSIYLYRNGWRLARATFLSEGQLHLTFNNAKTRDKWQSGEERLASGRWPLRERRFLRRFEPVHTLKETHCLQFQRKTK